MCTYYLWNKSITLGRWCPTVLVRMEGVRLNNHSSYSPANTRCCFDVDSTSFDRY